MNNIIELQNNTSGSSITIGHSYIIISLNFRTIIEAKKYIVGNYVVDSIYKEFLKICQGSLKNLVSQIQ